MTRWARWALAALMLVPAGVMRCGLATAQTTAPPRPHRAHPVGTWPPDGPRRVPLRPYPPSPAPDLGPLEGVLATCLGDGSTVDLGAALAGRLALINVWASWCRPCR